MSEPTKKKMLEWLSKVEYLTNRYAKNSREDDRRFQILHRLIENSDGPEVDEQFIEGYAWELSCKRMTKFLGPAKKLTINDRKEIIRKMLHEVRVRIKGGRR
jgi:hypothetical protein